MKPLTASEYPDKTARLYHCSLAVPVWRDFRRIRPAL